MEMKSILYADSVFLTFSDKVITKAVTPRLINEITNWENFQKYLEENIKLNLNLKTVRQLEIETENFMQTI